MSQVIMSILSRQSYWVEEDMTVYDEQKKEVKHKVQEPNHRVVLLLLGIVGLLAGVILSIGSSTVT